jgi:hypothetical protein
MTRKAVSKTKTDAGATAVDALTEAAAKAELTRLAAEIGEHDKRYYQEDAPTVSDAAYDALRRRNEAIEARFPHLVRPDSPSVRVGSVPAASLRCRVLPVAQSWDATGADEEGLLKWRTGAFPARPGADRSQLAATKLVGLQLAYLCARVQVVPVAPARQNAEAHAAAERPIRSAAGGRESSI